MDRRTLIRTGGLGLIGLGFEACSRAAGPSVLSQPHPAIRQCFTRPIRLVRWENT